MMSALFIAPASFAQSTYSFNLPEQPLADSLRAIGQQTEMNILFEPDAVRGIRSLALRGSYSVDDALRWVLKGTKLEAQHTTATNVVVKLRSATSTVLPAAGGRLTTNSETRIAQSSPGASVAVSIGNAQSDNEQKSKGNSGLEEIVVTGSRIPVPSGQQLAQPVQIYSRQDIGRSGQTTVADFLNTLSDVSINSTPNSAFLGRTTVQLHGLPTGTTLTLLDGRRVESSYYGYFDLGAIPAAAIERIEVLPVGSSAVYGSDGLGGAVNFILRKDFDGFEANTKYARDIGSGEDDFNMAWGKTFDRGSVSLVASYQGRTELSSNDRYLTSTSNLPASASYQLTDTCAPGIVYSLPAPGTRRSVARI